MQRQSPASRRINPRFLELARDPRIIPGVHRGCDEWCEYCPLTDRCLLFQCTREFQRVRRRPPPHPTPAAAFRTAAEAIDFARDFDAADDESARGNPGAADGSPAEEGLIDDDRLAGVALEYSRRSRQFVTSTSPAARRHEHKEPPPVETVLRFHTRIYFKATRALVGYRLVASGMANRGTEAKFCARQTIAYVERSRAALAQFSDCEERRALDALLDALVLGIEARFPDARFLRKVFEDRAA